MPLPGGLVLPAALIRIWADPRGPQGLGARREAGAGRPGVSWLGEELCAVVPVAADPAIFDLAVTVAREAVARDRGCSVLVLPGQIETRRGGSVAALPDPLLDDLAREPPPLAPGAVHSTAHAVARLEFPRRLAPAGFFPSTSGERIPFARVDGENPAAAPPWRNPVLLRRRPAYVARPALDAALGEATGARRVSGPLGSGKSRALWEALHREPGRTVLWLTARPARHGGPSLAAQLLHRLLLASPNVNLPDPPDLGLDLERLGADPECLLEPRSAAASLAHRKEARAALATWVVRLSRDQPLALVADGLESAEEADWSLLAALLAAGHQVAGLHLAACGRSGTAWPAGWSTVPLTEVPAFSEAEGRPLAESLLAGLGMPGPLAQRLLAEAAGHPFAIEEGLHSLVHRGHLRQVYGSFFCAAPEEVPLGLSPRFVQHAEAEAQRLGDPRAVALLAIAGLPVPPAILGEAAGGATSPAAGAGAIPQEGWERPFEEAGWLERADSPWGPGVRLRYPAAGLALAEELPPGGRLALRHALGGTLPAAARRGAFQRYRLLAGCSQASLAVLDAADDPEANEADLADALAVELEAHRQRGGDPATELELLWQLLPLERRLGRLRDRGEELARAKSLAQADPRRWIALVGLSAELEEEAGLHSAAEATLRAALLRPDRSDEASRAVLVLHLSRLLLRQERFGEARELLEPALPVLEAMGRPALLASALFYLGNAALKEGQPAWALDYHQRALALRREHAGPEAVGASLSALGRTTMRLGHYPQAISHFREAETLFAAESDGEHLAFALLGLGAALGRLGDYAAASAPLRRALALREAGDDAVGRELARLAVADNHLDLGRPTEALKAARKAYFDLRILPDQTAAVAAAEQLLGRTLLALRQLPEARRHFASALATHRRLGSGEEGAEDLAGSLEVALAGADADEVRRLVPELEAAIAECPRAERRERLELRLYEARRLLSQGGEDPRRALPPLRRAYRGLLAKAARLASPVRHRFLQQVPEHRAIVAAATELGLSFPDIPVLGD